MSNFIIPIGEERLYHNSDFADAYESIWYASYPLLTNIIDVTDVADKDEADCIREQLICQAWNSRTWKP